MRVSPTCPCPCPCPCPISLSETRRIARSLLSAAALAPLRALRDELRHERGPARLVRRAEASPVLAVEVLVERHQVLEVRVALHLAVRRAAVRRAPSIPVANEERSEPLR